MSNEAKRVIDNAKSNAAYAHLERLMPDVARQADLVARIRWINYDASIRQGFTPEQAIILCLKPNMTE
jgi:hypothetical protein